MISLKRLPLAATGLLLATELHAHASEQAWKEKREIRFTTTNEDGLNFNVSLTHPIAKFRGVPLGGDELHFEGQAQYDKGQDPYLGTKFYTILKALPEGGGIKAGEGVLEVRTAKAVTLLLACTTDFNQANSQQPLPDGW